MRISDWSSDVCSSDLDVVRPTSVASGRGIDVTVWETFPLPTDDLPVPTKIEWFCFPNGIRVISAPTRPEQRDRKSVVSGKSVSVRVDPGGRRIIKKKKQIQYKQDMRIRQVNNY